LSISFDHCRPAQLLLATRLAERLRWHPSSASQRRPAASAPRPFQGSAPRPARTLPANRNCVFTASPTRRLHQTQTLARLRRHRLPQEPAAPQGKWAWPCSEHRARWAASSSWLAALLVAQLLWKGKKRDGQSRAEPQMLNRIEHRQLCATRLGDWPGRSAAALDDFCVSFAIVVIVGALPRWLEDSRGHVRGCIPRASLARFIAAGRAFSSSMRPAGARPTFSRPSLPARSPGPLDTTFHKPLQVYLP
jgi:hypothetical protein